MKTERIIATFILLTAAAVASPGGGHSHEHSPGEGGHAHGHGAAEAHGEVKVPAAMPELWAAMRAGQAALVGALEKRDGASVHDIAERLIAYAGALPEKLGTADEAVKKRVAGQAKNLARVYGEIHHAAEAGAFDKALKDAARAGAVLKLLEPQVAPEK